MTEIQQRLVDFIERELDFECHASQLNRLAGDASERQYFRYLSRSGEAVILTAYPEPFDPDTFTYQQVYHLLREIGLPVPEIIALDGELGIVLQEDLGDESLQDRLLTAAEQERGELLHQAIDHIVTIQQEGTKALKPEYEASVLAFDEEKLNSELLFFHRHFLRGYRGLEVTQEETLLEEFARLSSELAGLPRLLCHRDYHVRNLMLKDGKIYIIDFQDARQGPPSYDVVSLLKDSIELDPEEVDEYRDHYLSKAPLDGKAGDFVRQFHCMCIQRLLKALGTYGFQITERGNDLYRQYVSGSLQRALLSLQAVPEFPYIQSIVEGSLTQ
jgi:aminoglycoside/choline kinase family phosphotransferase